MSGLSAPHSKAGIKARGRFPLTIRISPHRTCTVRLCRRTLGQDRSELDGLLDTVMEREHRFPGPCLCRAMGGLDTAVRDARGKMSGKPVVELLGSPGPLRAYASSMKRDITPAAEVDRLAPAA